jgi:hypothetical protein
MVDATVADRPPQRTQRRGGLPLGILGALVLLTLLTAYLSDCIPGLGPSGEHGPPVPVTVPPEGSAPMSNEVAGERITLVVQGDQCRRGSAEPQSCAELCAALDRTTAATVEIVIEATAGRHGTVEELRRCIQEAGFARIRVLAE